MELKLGSPTVPTEINALLIVPYGIETVSLACNGCIVVRLLIVPYGIETLYQYGGEHFAGSFNRTLWN